MTIKKDYYNMQKNDTQNFGKKPTTLKSLLICLVTISTFMPTALLANFDPVTATQESFEKLPNSCFLLALKAQKLMGRGDILIVWWRITEDQMRGHAFLMDTFGDKGEWYLYDEHGSKLFKKHQGLHAVIAQYVGRMGVKDFGYRILYYKKE